MFIAMNRFRVQPGKGDEYEQIWQERESHLAGVPGFVQFALLCGDDGEYISHSRLLARHADGPRASRRAAVDATGHPGADDPP